MLLLTLQIVTFNFNFTPFLIQLGLLSVYFLNIRVSQLTKRIQDSNLQVVQTANIVTITFLVLPYLSCSFIHTEYLYSAP